MRCPDCGELFEDEQAFDLHRRPMLCVDPRLDLRYRVTNRGEWSCAPHQMRPRFYQLRPDDDQEMTYGRP